jgi:hypothetical protein
MPTLSTRQYIMIGIMFLVVLYGASELLFTGGKSPATAGKATQKNDLTTFVNEINASMSKDTPSPLESHIIKRAEAQWLRDPFFARKSYRELALSAEPAQAAKAPTPAAQKIRFNYTGYVEIGHKKIAIVNGNEFAKGDALDMEGNVLKDISPSRITIYDKESRRTLEIPLQE